MLQASPAQVLVVVGAIAGSAFESYLHRSAEDHLLGPLEVAGKNRVLVVVPHPNPRGATSRWATSSRRSSWRRYKRRSAGKGNSRPRWTRPSPRPPSPISCGGWQGRS
ncbi:MAG: hypothetical protein ACYCUD_10200 [Candidatus Dormibacteria bacterium]